MKTIIAKPHYPDAFHIGFMIDKLTEVTEIYRQLNMAGIVVHEGFYDRHANTYS